MSKKIIILIVIMLNTRLIMLMIKMENALGIIHKNPDFNLTLLTAIEIIIVIEIIKPIIRKSRNK